jgi:hypothetical protein
MPTTTGKIVRCFLDQATNVPRQSAQADRKDEECSRFKIYTGYELVRLPSSTLGGWIAMSEVFDV